MESDYQELVNDCSGLVDHETIESMEGTSPLEEQKAMVAIQEAWEDIGSTFRLCDVKIHRQAMDFLLLKWGVMRSSQKNKDIPDKKIIKKVILDRCWFSESTSGHLMATFLHKIGSNLKELSICDALCQYNENAIEQPLSSLLSYPKCTASLEKLEIRQSDMRGAEMGYCLRCILANNSNLTSLLLPDCSMEEESFQQFLIGLQYHLNLKYINLSGWGMTKKQVRKLVDAILYCWSRKFLKRLDITGTAINQKTMDYLSRLDHVEILHDEPQEQDAASTLTSSSLVLTLATSTDSFLSTTEKVGPVEPKVSVTDEAVEGALSLMLCT